jgi:hypothetical protein
MWGHVSDRQLVDVLEGSAAASSREHAEACERCRERLSALRSGLALAREADVPEPSPLYWETFRSQVDVRLGREGERAASGLRLALVAAALLVALLAALPLSRSGAPAGPVTLPAWSALPPLAEDSNLALLAQLDAPEEELLVASSRQGLPGMLAELSEAEKAELLKVLESELQRGKS